MLKEANEYLEALQQERRLTDNTLSAYQRDLKQYVDFLTREVHCSAWADVSEVSVMKYFYWLRDRHRASATVARKASAVRGLHRYLYRYKKADTDPAYAIVLPGVERTPPEILSDEEVDRLLSAPDSDTGSGKRDQAMLELLYATGIRASELINLNLSDLNLQLGFVRCKGIRGNERVIPLGQSAKHALHIYLNDVRKAQEDRLENSPLFLNNRHRRLTRQGVWKILKNYGSLTGIGSTLSPETLRNTLTARMLENGADMASVDEIMGREHSLALNRYPRRSNSRLRDVYVRFHPRR
ncbi:tyrosine-type recombinase/integrase [Sporolactobacillus sp. Y61]|uniref:Tyrosine-type recombinase/integrase n=1 Tax=Sporolactobacillus sp. Y61 TaxID=3160863 RepID=A0AAU8IDH4_9BACL